MRSRALREAERIREKKIQVAELEWEPRPEDYQLIIRGWEDLQTERRVVVGFAGGQYLPLTWKQRKEWLDTYRVRDPYRSLVNRMWVRMDGWFLEEANKEETEDE